MQSITIPRFSLVFGRISVRVKQHGVAKPRRLYLAKASEDTSQDEEETVASVQVLENTVASVKEVSYSLISKPSKGLYSISSGEELNVISAGIPALVRAGNAAFVSLTLFRARKRPTLLLELYEFEGCPFCKKVREALSILDLDVLIYPCPSNGPNFRPKSVELSGKSQFPFLVDPNSGRKILESDDIVSYLWNEYGDGEENIPVLLRPGLPTTLSLSLSLVPRFGKGSSYKKSVTPAEPLVFWGYEASPFCKIVRETLTELEIPHVYKSVARNSPKRAELFKKWNVFQVPYLEDPNTGSALFETKPIVSYLLETYGEVKKE